MPRRRRPAGLARTPWDVRRHLCHGARRLSRRERRRPADRSFSICRAAARTASRAIRRRVGHQQRGARAVRAGPVAGRPRPDPRLRTCAGTRSSCRRRRSDDHRVCAIPERSALPVRRDDSGPVEAVSATGWLRVGRRRQGARPLSAPAPACFMRGRTC